MRLFLVLLIIVFSFNTMALDTKYRIKVVNFDNGTNEPDTGETLGKYKGKIEPGFERIRYRQNDEFIHAVKIDIDASSRLNLMRNAVGVLGIRSNTPVPLYLKFDNNRRALLAKKLIEEGDITFYNDEYSRESRYLDIDEDDMYILNNESGVFMSISEKIDEIVRKEEIEKGDYRGVKGTFRQFTDWVKNDGFYAKDKRIPAASENNSVNRSLIEELNNGSEESDINPRDSLSGKK
jgi:hypothetical protein